MRQRRIRMKWLGIDAVIVPAGKFEEMQARIALAEKRAAAQRASRAERSKSCPPGLPNNVLETL